MGLFGRKYDGSAIRNAEPVQPQTLPFMNGPDLLGNPTSGQTYQDPRGPMPVQKKGGFFGHDGFGRYLAGAIGDGLAMNAGMQPAFANSIENQRIMQMYKQRQDDELAQYERKQQIEAQYPKPYRWESNNGSLMELGPDGQARELYKDPTPKVNWVRADNGDGTFTMVPMTQSGAAQPTETDTLPEGYSVRGAGSGQRGFR